MPNKHIPRLTSALSATKPGFLFAAAGISCLLCINALRTNNLEMVKLRNAVYETDKNNGDVRGALTDLQHYVVSHMNTDLTPGRSAVYPPIQLKYTYERLQAAANKPVSSEQLYNDAQVHCEKLNPTDFSGRNRVPCIQEYVKTNQASATPKQIPDSLYKFDFVSPAWSPDTAGWSLVSTVLLVVLAVVSTLLRRSSRRR